MNPARFRLIGSRRVAGGRAGVPFTQYRLRGVNGAIPTVRNFFDAMYQAAQRTGAAARTSVTVNFTGLRGIRSVGLGGRIWNQPINNAYTRFLRKIDNRYAAPEDDSNTLIDLDGDFMALDTGSFSLVSR